MRADAALDGPTYPCEIPVFPAACRDPFYRGVVTINRLTTTCQSIDEMICSIRWLGKEEETRVAKDGNSAFGSRAADNEALAFFTRADAAIADAAMSRIFPSDGSAPGAHEAGTVVYLDRALAGAEMHLQGAYRTGLKRLDGIARKQFGAGFADSTPAQQDELLGAMAEGRLKDFGEGPSASDLFEMLRAHTIEGLFSDPVHGGNRGFTGWKLLGYHGPQPSYSHAEQQLDAVIRRDRIFSAADYPLPAEGAAK
jgi:gluconate 2-dehydrogenase gamma chain